jgi:hypothetical protein
LAAGESRVTPHRPQFVEIAPKHVGVAHEKPAVVAERSLLHTGMPLLDPRGRPFPQHDKEIGLTSLLDNPLTHDPGGDREGSKTSR